MRTARPATIKKVPSSAITALAFLRSKGSEKRPFLFPNEARRKIADLAQNAFLNGRVSFVENKAIDGRIYLSFLKLVVKVKAPSDLVKPFAV